MSDPKLIKLSPDMEKDISNLIEWSNNLAITDNYKRSMVMNDLKKVKDMKQRIIAFFKDSKDKAYATWKSIVAQEKSFTDVLDRVEENVKRKILSFDQEERRRREEEQRRLQAIADEQARRERERLMKKAESLKTPEKREALLEQAESIVPPQVQIPEPEKEKGEYTRKIWKARVVDVNKLPREYMIPNEKLLDNIAKTTKGAMRIDGVEFYCEEVLAVRR